MGETQVQVAALGPARLGRMPLLFFIGSVLMVVHKLESLWQGEYLIDPNYAAMAGYLAEPKYALVALIVTLVMNYALVLGMSHGGRGPLVVFGVAAVVYSHEIHHFVRSLVRGGYYPGTATGVVVAAFSVVFWRELRATWRRWGRPAL